MVWYVNWSGSCQVCGYKKSLGALSFHHKNPDEKDFQISSKSYAYEKLKKEVDKCILVCSNCHIEIHEEIKNFGYSDIARNLF
jgi:5-methylcytosine-specific restriction endonuclease McrA